MEEKACQTECVGLPPLVRISPPRRVVLKMKNHPLIDYDARTESGLPLLTCMPDGVKIKITGTPATTDAEVWTLLVTGIGPSIEVEADEDIVILHPDADDAINIFEKRMKRGRFSDKKKKSPRRESSVPVPAVIAPPPPPSHRPDSPMDLNSSDSEDDMPVKRQCT